MSKNLNSKLKKRRELYMWFIKAWDCQMRWDADRMGRGMQTAQNMLSICYQIELDKLNIYVTPT
jgi:hypothetical protein